MTNINVRNYLDLSTAHVTDFDLNCTHSQLRNYFLATYEYGAFIYVPEENDTTLPQYVNSIFDYARKQNCDMIRFDADADIVDNLESFNW